MALIDISVDTDGLDQVIADLTNRFDDLDIESAVSDSLDNILEDRIDNDLSNRDFATQDDVRNALSDYVTEDQIAAAVRDELTNCDFADANDLLDEDDVKRIAHDVLADADNVLATDLARRLDIYAQRIDQLRSENTALGAALANQREAQLDYQRQLNLLRQDVDTLNEQAGKAITLFELLRRAVEVLFK